MVFELIVILMFGLLCFKEGQYLEEIKHKNAEEEIRNEMLIDYIKYLKMKANKDKSE